MSVLKELIRPSLQESTQQNNYTPLIDICETLLPLLREQYTLSKINPDIVDTSRVLEELILPHMSTEEIVNLYKWLPHSISEDEEEERDDEVKGIYRSLLVELCLINNRWEAVEALYALGWHPSVIELTKYKFMLWDTVGELSSPRTPSEDAKKQAQWFVTKQLLRKKDLPSTLFASRIQ